MCLYCKEEGKHYVIYCTYGSHMVGCSEHPVQVLDHLKNDCVVGYCDVHGWTTEPMAQHFTTCSICKSAYECEASCPNGCCAKCSPKNYGSGLCHCLGPCGQKGCSCSDSESYNLPQHVIETLKTFGCVDEKGKPFDLHADARLFYGAVAMYQMKQTEDNRRILADLSSMLASRFLTAIVTACAGEFRSAAINDTGHMWVQRTYGAQANKKGKLSRDEMNFHFDLYYLMSRPRGMGKYVRYIRATRARSEGDQRTSSALVFKKWVIDKYGIEVGLRHNVNFWRMQGGGGVGGDRWADAAWVGLQYAKGLMTPMMFVDLAFNLQHNNAILFTKTHKIHRSLQEWLNQRQKCEPEWLIDRAPPELKETMGFKDFKSTTTTKMDATVDKRATQVWSGLPTPPAVKKEVKESVLA
jgi:hypothetical protein